DQVVWTEVIRLLEDPTLIQHELDRRLSAARSSDPTKKREQTLQRELTSVGKSIERILSAYQEGLVSLEQLRERMPPLRQRDQALRAEAQAIADQANDRAKFLRLAETLTDFLTRLRVSANTLDVTERQRIVRLVVKDVLIGDDSLVIRHCIPIGAPPPSDGTPPAAGRIESASKSTNYLLRKGSNNTTLWDTSFTRGLEYQTQKMHHLFIIHPLSNFREQHIVPHVIEITLQVNVNDACLPSHNTLGHSADRFMRCPLSTVAIRSRLKVCIQDWL